MLHAALVLALPILVIAHSTPPRAAWRDQIALSVLDFGLEAYTKVLSLGPPRARPTLIATRRARGQHAFPADEVKPLSCTGTNASFGGVAMTAIDALDALAATGRVDSFRHTLGRVLSLLRVRRGDGVAGVPQRGRDAASPGGPLPRLAHVASALGRWLAGRVRSRGASTARWRPFSFADVDHSVSVFEGTIRILGGLLGAHTLLVDARTGPLLTGARPAYRGQLLTLALDFARALRPALRSQTGVPWSAVHYARGVKPGELPVTCTACAGSLALEFTALSRLVGDWTWEADGLAAAVAVYRARTRRGLVGAHLDVRDGRWTHTDSGVGSHVDSYLETLLKHHAGTGNPLPLVLFAALYAALVRDAKFGSWYLEVDAESGQPTWAHFGALQGHWPAVQVMYGDLRAAADTLAAFAEVATLYGLAPERLDLATGRPVPGQTHYALRPELLESAFFLFEASPDAGPRALVHSILANLAARTPAPCGMATLRDVTKLRETAGHAAVASTGNGSGTGSEPWPAALAAACCTAGQPPSAAPAQSDVGDGGGGSQPGSASVLSHTASHDTHFDTPMESFVLAETAKYAFWAGRQMGRLDCGPPAPGPRPAPHDELVRAALSSLQAGRLVLSTEAHLLPTSAWFQRRHRPNKGAAAPATRHRRRRARCASQHAPPLARLPTLWRRSLAEQGSRRLGPRECAAAGERAASLAADALQEGLDGENCWATPSAEARRKARVVASALQGPSERAVGAVVEPGGAWRTLLRAEAAAWVVQRHLACCAHVSEAILEAAGPPVQGYARQVGRLLPWEVLLKPEGGMTPVRDACIRLYDGEWVVRHLLPELRRGFSGRWRVG